MNEFHLKYRLISESPVAIFSLETNRIRNQIVFLIMMMNLITPMLLNPQENYPAEYDAIYFRVVTEIECD